MDSDIRGNNIETPIGNSAVKGNKHFADRWKPSEKRDSSLEIATSPKEEKIFHLEFHSEGEKLKVRQFEGLAWEQKTLRHYEDTIISYNKTKEYSKCINNILSSANRSGRVCKKDLINLKKAGQLLYNELFPSGIKKSLNSTSLNTFILVIDDNLVSIPWELAYDGQEFLCQRFNMGRVVSTRQQVTAVQREIVPPLKMLIITDPQGNLPASYEEGVKLRNLLDQKMGEIKVDLKSSEVNTNYVRGTLKLYDIFHYAGHAEYNEQMPGESGFMLKDGKLTANAITEMIDRMPFPSFVFSNACQSGQTKEWKLIEGYKSVYGIANAFLLSGVRHYLGTFWEIQDESGFYFSLRFYEELLSGAMIGEAVRKARKELIERYGEDTIIWASYLLYGVPSFRYVSQSLSSERGNQSCIRLNNIPVSPVRTLDGSKKVFSFTKWRHNWHKFAIPIIVILLFWASIIILNIFKKSGPSPPYKVEVNVISSSREKRFENTIELIEKIDDDIKNDDTPKVKRYDEWTSEPVILVLLDIKGIGISDIERDYIQGYITKFLQNTSRITIVEREILDNLLREHELSYSDLANPSTALRIGRMLSAGLISTGSIAREKNMWIVSLRFVDTETTAVKIAISTGVETADLSLVSEEIGTRIFNDLKKIYPLQGRIISADETGIYINLGSDLGLNKGELMDVLSADNKIIGKIEAVEVTEARTMVKVISGEGRITESLRVKEIISETEDKEEKHS